MTYQLTESDWTEIRRISGDLMDAVMAGSTASASGQASIKRHIEIILSREVATAQDGYEAKLREEETHRWEFGHHPIAECRIDWCGRYRGQRR